MADQQGLFEWATSVRRTLQTDPAIFIFQDQVQSHGFDFLDDYVDQLLHGPALPIHDLHKTPGKKNPASVKYRGQASPSKLRNATTNSPELNSFHQTLLHARDATPPPQVIPEQAAPTLQSNSSNLLEIPNDKPEQNELSIIAEDDESTEKTRVSMSNVNSSVHENVPVEEILSPPEEHAIDAASIPSHKEVKDSVATKPETSEPVPNTSHLPESARQTTSFKFGSENFTAPLPEIPPWNPRAVVIDESNTAPLPSLPNDEFLSKLTERKAYVPTLPMQKSMRNNGTATPGAALGGKRTSWLMKAREVKAMEETGKRMSVLVGTTSNNLVMPVPGMTTKRKSVDMFSNAALATTDNIPAEEDRKQKIAKMNLVNFEQIKPKDVGDVEIPTKKDESLPLSVAPEGVLSVFKKTLDNLGGRTGKSMGNVAAANALAEARAAAEARVAEREMTEALGEPSVRHDVVMSESVHVNSRLSVSELAPKRPEPVSEDADIANMSTSTTPPNSPPAVPAPVFNKPPPVFTAPVQNTKPLFSTFTKPAINSVGLGIHSPSSISRVNPQPVTATSTLERVGSDNLFDNVPAWMPQSQDNTDYAIHHSQPKPVSPAVGSHMNDLDEEDDDSFDDKMVTGEQWVFGNNKEDSSMTWSTQPTQSVHGPASNEQTDNYQREPDSVASVPGAFEVDDQLDDQDMYPQLSSALDYNHDMAQSQASDTTAESQGLFGKAIKTMSSVLGSSKKSKPEVKSLQLAASVAKKQQEEKDKKASRLKEMENRRLLINQKKADEEKAKSMEQERKLKDEAERRKREREELTDKRPLKQPPMKKDEKRKVVPEAEKKNPEVKKTVSRTTKPSVSKIGAPSKSALKHAQSVNSSFSQSIMMASTSATAIKASETSKASSSKSKAAMKMPIPDDDISQPSQVLQTQMAARANAQLQAAKAVAEPTENIELPDINSEYSDSEDEDRVRTFDPPDWAQSPELRQALRLQSTINPDDIFGEIRPLRMEEVFRTRTSRFRARTSSANWTGSDRLTIQEELEYARRMGYQNPQA